MVDNKDTQATWLPVIGKALAYLCLQEAQRKEPKKFELRAQACEISTRPRVEPRRRGGSSREFTGFRTGDAQPS